MRMQTETAWKKSQGMPSRTIYPNGWWESRESFEFKIVIHGAPVILKNSKVIAPAGKRCRACGFARTRKILPNDRVASWMRYAALTMVSMISRKWILGLGKVKVNAAMVSYMPTRARVDLDNSLGAPSDALQNGGVIVDDSQIKSYDGSRVRYDKEDPRVEITLTPFLEGE